MTQSKASIWLDVGNTYTLGNKTVEVTNVCVCLTTAEAHVSYVATSSGGSRSETIRLKDFEKEFPWIFRDI